MWTIKLGVGILQIDAGLSSLRYKIKSVLQPLPIPGPGIGLTRLTGGWHLSLFAIHLTWIWCVSKCKVKKVLGDRNVL